MFDFRFNNKNASELGVYAISRPAIVSPERNVQLIEVPGRNGSVTLDDETYKDIEIDINCNFKVKKADDFGRRTRMIKSWLNSKTDNRLIFNDDLDFCRLVKKTTISKIERQSKYIGTFEINFVCAPFEFLLDGFNEHSLEECKVNPYDTSKPIYHFIGEGMAHLEVNGNYININVGQNAYVDTELQLTYNGNGDIVNTDLNGNYEKLYLKSGENDLLLESKNGVQVQVKPRWCCL